jgi:hypothetical protein
MPRYFFYLRDHSEVLEDLEGMNWTTTRLQKPRRSRPPEALRINQLSVREWLGRSYDIADETGRLVAVNAFPDAIDVRNSPDPRP